MSAQNNKDYCRKVYACALKNISDSDAKVVLTYEGIPNEKGETNQTRSNINVAKDKTHYQLEKLVTRTTYNIREVIESIEVSLANGKKMELKAPFEGVTSPTVDWYFIIDNTHIQSAGPTPVFGK